MKHLNAIRAAFWAFLFMLLFSACERDHLYFGNKDMAIVQLNINWDSCHLSPNGATVVAYNENGDIYTHYAPFSNPRMAQIALPPGRYNLVVFNNTPAEYEGMIGFRNEQLWSTYEAYSLIDPIAAPVSRPKKVNSNDNDNNDDEEEKTAEELEAELADQAFYALASEPDTLAVAQFHDLEVTPDMVTYYWDVPGARSADGQKTLITEIDILPKRVVSEAQITVHVTGLKNTTGSVHGYLRGVAAGYFLGLDIYSSEAVAHEFWFRNRTYDEGSTSDGTLTTSFYTFGPCRNEDQHYYLDLIFTLVNGETYPVTIDVTDRIEANINLQMTIQMQIEVTLPEVVGGNENGGFQADLSQWEDVIQSIDL